MIAAADDARIALRELIARRTQLLEWLKTLVANADQLRDETVLRKSLTTMGSAAAWYLLFLPGGCVASALMAGASGIGTICTALTDAEAQLEWRLKEDQREADALYSKLQEFRKICPDLDVGSTDPFAPRNVPSQMLAVTTAAAAAQMASRAASSAQLGASLAARAGSAASAASTAATTASSVKVGTHAAAAAVGAARAPATVAKSGAAAGAAAASAAHGPATAARAGQAAMAAASSSAIVAQVFSGISCAVSLGDLIYTVMSESTLAHTASMVLEEMQRSLKELEDCHEKLTQCCAFLSGFALAAACTPTSEKIAGVLALVLTEHFESAEDFFSLTRSHDLQSLFDYRFSTQFSPAADFFGLRGGRPYHKPRGWLRFSLRVADFDRYADWRVAYHGTRDRAALSILLKGLQGPRTRGAVAVNGQVGGSGNTIYTSPSIEYAAHPAYARFLRLEDDRWGQLVLQCRVRPGSAVEQASTLKADRWPPELPVDEQLPDNSTLEWLLEDDADVVVTALMVRELGPFADASVYGPLAARVRKDGHPDGPEAHWLQLRAEDAAATGAPWM